MLSLQILFIILTIIFFCHFILSIINYSKSQYSLEYYELRDPEIRINGLSKINFIENNRDNEIRDNIFDISNLGTTGQIKFDCYTGICYFEKKLDDSKPIEELKVLDCSTDCRVNKNGNCSKYSCSTDDYSFKDNIKSECLKEERDEENIDKQSCYIDNLILYWRGLYYYRTNFSNVYYKYSEYAIPANEKCPYNTRSCGRLDDFGSKFCIDKTKECPINFITMNRTEIEKITTNYKAVNLNGNKTIYYTNEAYETGNIVQGLFVDTDLALQYTKDCEILDTENITELFKDHKNRLYKDILNYDPYKDYNTNSKGKSYLKWCLPGFGQIKNPSRVKELLVEYGNNITFNGRIEDIKNVYNPNFFFELMINILILTLNIIAILTTLEDSSKYKLNIFGCDPQFLFFPMALANFAIFGFYVSSLKKILDVYKDDEGEDSFYSEYFVYEIIDIIKMVLSVLYFIFIIIYRCFENMFS